MDFNLVFYKELRKILFRNGMTCQEFFSYLIRLTVTGDNRIDSIIREAKVPSAIFIDIPDLVRCGKTDTEALYNFIEEYSPFEDKEE